MTELATTRPADMVGAFDPRNEQILAYLGLSPKDPKSTAVVAVARRYNLDPLLKHVIVIPGKGVYITRDGYLHIAHESRQLDGIVVEQEPTLSHDKKEWVSRVTVWRKDMGHPFTFPGRYPVNGSNREYAQEMALKAAESHALRRAFNVAGLPSYEEERPQQAEQASPSRPRPKTVREAIAPAPEPAQPPTVAADELGVASETDYPKRFGEYVAGEQGVVWPEAAQPGSGTAADR